MFDPFKDFETAGYLRNIRRHKDERVIKATEHYLFQANLNPALTYLASKPVLAYQDFLEIHRILFSDYYPWAGQDRSMTLPDRAVKKGDVLFAHPQSSRLAINQGLRMGQDVAEMNQKLGEVMGLFAFGHPFLDGNGRTMLLVHIELAYRAGFSIAWESMGKAEYLDVLGQEIASPGKGILDDYLLQFKGPQVERGHMGKRILLIKGLDGLDEANQVDGSLLDPVVAKKYQEFERRRGYSYSALDPVCKICGMVPCVCNDTGYKPRTTGRSMS